MTTVLAERFNEHREFAEADPELLLTESAGLVPESLRESVLANAPEQPPDTHLLQIIRPGVGRGRGRRYYSPDVLRESAPLFKGKRMFANHETDRQRRERENLPRRVEDLGGRIVESWWDDSVPADDRFEQGAMFGWVKPVGIARQLIEQDPEIMEASISALATRVTPGTVKGQSCTIVEGIRPSPITVDWIAGEGGAGGKLLSEAAEEEAVLESMADDEIEEYLEEARPGLLEALRENAHGGSGGGNGNRHKEDEMPDISPEVLSEAFASDEGKQLIDAAVAEAVKNHRPEVDSAEVERIVEAKVSEATDLARIETRGEFERKVELRDMRDKARALVEAAKLHPLLKQRIEEQFRLDEAGEPTAALNIASDLDDDGNVAKPAMDKLVEAVTEEITNAQKLQADLRPTQVRGQGAGSRMAVTPRDRGTTTTDTALRENEGGDGGGKKEPTEERSTTGSDLTDELFESAGVPHAALGRLWSTSL